MKTFGVFRSIYSRIRHLKIMMDEMSRLLCTLPHWVLRRLLSPHTLWKIKNFTLIIFFGKNSWNQRIYYRNPFILDLTNFFFFFLVRVISLFFHTDLTVCHVVEINEIYSHSSHTLCAKMRENNAFTKKSLKVDLTKYLLVESKFCVFL